MISFMIILIFVGMAGLLLPLPVGRGVLSKPFIAENAEDCVHLF
jgi:hypothetical protein